jgi:signal transduction histidine kinase
MDSIRRIVSGLYPSVLERYGLIDGINDLFDRAGRSDLELEIIDETDGTCASFDKPTQLALFRIIQESLNNTLKHSGATKVILQLSVSEGKLLIIYSDNGKGIAQDSGAKPDSFGISSMRRRAEMLHAQIEWRSPPAASFGTGTEVRVEMPLPATAVATCKSE